MEQTFCSRIWRLSDNIDTDIIIMSKYLAKPSLREMVPHLFEPLRPELAARLRPGDAIVAGENFGCGSSREMAASVLKTAGIRCIIAKSFAKIFFRNAINNGLLLIECRDLYDRCREGDTVKVEVGRQIICNGTAYPVPGMSTEVSSVTAAWCPGCGRWTNLSRPLPLHGTRCGTSTVQAIPWRSSSSSTTPAHRTYAPETW